MHCEEAMMRSSDRHRVPDALAAACWHPWHPLLLLQAQASTNMLFWALPSVLAACSPLRLLEFVQLANLTFLKHTRKGSRGHIAHLELSDIALLKLDDCARGRLDLAHRGRADAPDFGLPCSHDADERARSPAEEALHAALNLTLEKVVNAVGSTTLHKFAQFRTSSQQREVLAHTRIQFDNVRDGSAEHAGGR